jgi:hypothetical protein
MESQEAGAIPYDFAAAPFIRSSSHAISSVGASWNTVVAEAFDDVILRWHATGGDLALGFGDDVVVAPFFVPQAM